MRHFLTCIVIVSCLSCAPVLKQEEMGQEKQQPVEDTQTRVERKPYMFILKDGQEDIANNEKIIQVCFDSGQVIETSLQEGYQYLVQWYMQLVSIAAYYNAGVDRLVEIYEADLGLEIEIPEKVELQWILPYTHTIGE